MSPVRARSGKPSAGPPTPRAPDLLRRGRRSRRSARESGDSAPARDRGPADPACSRDGDGCPRWRASTARGPAKGHPIGDREGMLTADRSSAADTIVFVTMGHPAPDQVHRSIRSRLITARERNSTSGNPGHSRARPSARLTCGETAKPRPANTEVDARDVEHRSSGRPATTTRFPPRRNLPSLEACAGRSLSPRSSCRCSS